ncbi:hypothetical protein P5673_028470 [Acropora cervicornis]|uniref:Uncharacterized protein n=1 Tax=Acropora cervicornis TaxID=6130 RepID=A0AAD9UV58_ACRCE|nr:hypothetical protein P5673_028470 [Acropora cervicornis]
MNNISEAASLSLPYTNHSLRATAITLWSNAGIPNRHIMAISGQSETSKASHITIPDHPLHSYATAVLSYQEASTQAMLVANLSLLLHPQLFVKVTVWWLLRRKLQVSCSMSSPIAQSTAA